MSWASWIQYTLLHPVFQKSFLTLFLVEFYQWKACSILSVLPSMVHGPHTLNLSWFNCHDNIKWRIQIPPPFHFENCWSRLVQHFFTSCYLDIALKMDAAGSSRMLINTCCLCFYHEDRASSFLWNFLTSCWAPYAPWRWRRHVSWKHSFPPTRLHK
jgi:hypothetical protein